MRHSVRAFSSAVFALTLAHFLTGCFNVDPESDNFTITSQEAQFNLHVTQNDRINGHEFRTTVHSQPACGLVTSLYPGWLPTYRSDDDPQLEFDRSSGVAAGVYLFNYKVTVTLGIYGIEIYETAWVTLTLTESYPPGGSSLCQALHNPHIRDAWNTGSGVEGWWWPSGAADEYQIRLVDGDIGSGHPTLLTRRFAAPGSISRQALSLPAAGNTELLWVVLESILNGDIIFTDTFKGVQGFKDFAGSLQYASVDDSVTLVKGVTERATVDVLANDIDSEGGDTDRENETGRSHVSLTIIDDGGLDASVTDSLLVEVGAENVSAGRYKIEIETVASGGDPKTQYLYVTVLNPEDFSVTANPDRYTGPAFQSLRMPVLSNDSSSAGSALSLESFTQPGGGATVTQSGNELRIIGPVGNYTFSYYAKDEYGNVSGSATVTANLVNVAPVAVNDTAMSAVLTETIIDAIANDRDANINTSFGVSDSISLNSFTQPNPITGEVFQSGGKFYFIAISSGTYTFTYNIVDSYGAVSNTATVTVTVP